MGVVNAEPCSADMMVRRYPISDIDTSSEEAMSQWLINLFKDKVSVSDVGGGVSGGISIREGVQ